MRFLVKKMSDGDGKGKLATYCRVLNVSRQGYYKYLARQNRPWKYQGLAEAMRAIHEEDVCNDMYGCKRMYQALLLKRNFQAEKPLEKCVTDITEIKAKDGKLYISAIFDCFDSTVLGLAMDDNMKAELCVRTLKNAVAAYPALRGAIVHSDRGSQYTCGAYREAVQKYGIRQSMNSDGGRYHDNARCESMWARMKCELFYDRVDTLSLTINEIKAMVWRYFMIYWNRRRICSANDGLPPLVKRQRYYASLDAAA